MHGVACAGSRIKVDVGSPSSVPAQRHSVQTYKQEVMPSLRVLLLLGLLVCCNIADCTGAQLQD